MPFLRALVWLAVVVASLEAGPGRVRAQALTWLLDPAVPEDARERIVGQTSDLPFVLRPPASQGGSLPSVPEGDPLGRAARLALGTEARVVVWTAQREWGLEVTIVDLEARRVLVREVPASGPREHSAALETVGVIVRAALQALGEGGEIGVASAPVASQPPVPAEAEAADAASPEEPLAVPDSEDSLRREVMLGAGLGLRFVLDDGPAFEGSGTLAWRYGRLWLGAAVHGGMRQRVRSATAAISVAYAGAALEAGVVAFERGAFALVPVASLGVGRVRRETTRVADGFLGTGSRAHLDVRAAGGLRLRVALGTLAWLLVDARLELPLRRVLYTVNTDAGASTLARTPRAAPALGLSVLARIGRAR